MLWLALAVLWLLAGVLLVGLAAAAARGDRQMEGGAEPSRRAVRRPARAAAPRA